MGKNVSNPQPEMDVLGEYPHFRKPPCGFVEQIHPGLRLPSGKQSHNYGKIHHFQWVNQLFLWAMASIAMLVITEGKSH
jgi:hypothetical protein